MSANESIEIEQEDGVTVMTLGPAYANIDESMMADLRDAVLNAADTVDPPRLALNMANTQFFGSGFIEVIFRAYNRLAEREGGDFCLCGLTEYCNEIIEITNLGNLWKVRPTRANAVAELKP